MRQNVDKNRLGATTFRNYLAGLWLGLVLLVLAVHPVSAQTSVTTCGQTLSAAGQYVLASDLDCSGSLTNGVNITANKVVFHLAGHTLSSTDCDPTRAVAGIVVAGDSGVQIEGGTVRGFNDGIDLAATKSRVNGMTVTSACVFGIAVSGVGNRIDTSVVMLSGLDGVGIGAASGTHIESNNISANARVGVDISNFSNNNFVENNIINSNGLISGQGGVAIFNGTNNLIANNTLNNNFNGIEVESPGNTIQANTVNGSAGSGIFVLTVASPSVVQRNVALGNVGVDLSDDNTSCSGDTWKKNIFLTDLVAGSPDGGPKAGCIR